VKNSIIEPGKISRIAWYVVAVAFFGIALAVRIRLLSMPLERDEGEYAYAGQLMLQGFPPYKLAYNMKFPGTYAAYALIMSIFGQSIVGIHLGLLLVNAAAVFLIFVLGRQLLDSAAGLAAAASYAILSLSPAVLGLAAHATHFVVLPVLGGMLLLLSQSERYATARLFASGLNFGVGFLMKQPAVFFVLFAVIYMLCWQICRRLPLRKILARQVAFAAGAIFPLALTCALLWSAGVFDKFWFWAINYAREYASLIALSQSGQVFSDALGLVIGSAWPLWGFAAIGLVYGFCAARSRDATLAVFGLLVFSGLALCSGFYFRLHYFVLVLPVISLLVGLAMSNLANLSLSYSKMLGAVPFLLLTVAASFPLVREKKFLFEDSPVEACRALYPESPFPESIRIAQYVREHTDPADTIAVLGSEPQIYFYSKRHSATGYIYMYGLMEPHKYARYMQAEMMREIEATRPKYLISVVMEDSWLPRPTSDRQIFAWATEYTAKFYSVAGFVNIVARDGSDYYFDDVPSSVAQLGSYILIYRRKS
jgi:hypothetical protein